VGKAIQLGLRITRLGGGSSLPGLVGLRLDPNILQKIVGGSGARVILVTGSNGKTTTCKLIAGALSASGLRILGNTTGANLKSGLVSALIASSTLTGRIQADVIVFEVDEASMRRVIPDINPSVVVVTNCFRDQLDRYGEVDATLELIRQATDRMPESATLLLNADDPLVADLGRTARCIVRYYGLDAGPVPEPATRAREAGEADLSPRDVVNCLACGEYFIYEATTIGHLGVYSCPRCGRSRPALDFTARHIEQVPGAGYRFSVHWGAEDQIPISLRLPGLYNAYNGLAAAACCLVFGTCPKAAASGINSAGSAFGRAETVDIGDKRLSLVLVKNPVGLSEVAKSVAGDPSIAVIMFCLNDNYADGRDISWIWDADLSPMVERPTPFRLAVCSGVRAWDAALRLKYAGLDPSVMQVEPNLGRALDAALANTTPGETLGILPTYTAMLGVREEIRKRAHIRQFWRS
jgi:UDP-N-acetylmuramyl tripeptide synthase